MDGGETSRRRQSSALRRLFRNGDFAEEDVWNVLEQRSTTASKSSDDSDSFADSSFVESVYARIGSESAPRSIPQWFKPNGSKIERKFGSERDECSSDGGDSDGIGDCGGDDVDEDDEEEGFGNRVPPHELIARRLARAQISSFSVVEGVGRTLKGRDLSKVRNAVLIKTGFLESC